MELSKRRIESPTKQEVDQLLSSFNAKHFQEAERQAEELIKKYPKHPFGWKALGTVLQTMKRDRKALRVLLRSIQLDPQDAESHSSLGNTLDSLGRLEEAEVSYQNAIRLRPSVAELRSNYGNILRKLGRLTEAEASCRKAIQLKPELAEAHTNLGNTLRNLGHLKDAQTSHLEAIRLKPGLAEAHMNLGNVLRELERLTQAEASYRRAIYLNPGKKKTANAYSNLGITLWELGRLEEATKNYRKAIQVDPDYVNAKSNLLFCLNYLESLLPSEAFIEAKQFGEWASHKAKPKYDTWLDRTNPLKLRIGMVSGDLRNHPVGYCVEALIGSLDPNQFEAFAFPTTPRTDELTDRIRNYFQDWIPLYGKNDFEAASMIHDLGIQVLIDLSGHTANNRLLMFSYKPAPIQVSWLGYFATTGLPEMDYVLGDPVMSSHNEQQYFTEKIRNLPKTWLCHTPPNGPFAISDLPALTKGGITFGCFGKILKVNDGVIKIWSIILKKVPNSKLFLKSKSLSDLDVIRSIRCKFSSQGISCDRLILEGPSSRIDYFKAYERIDMVLDTFPYPGGTTSIEALWMGIPVLTLKGDRFLSHLGESIATNAGLVDWIAKDRNDYVKKAVCIASDLEELAKVRHELRERVLSSALFDTSRFAKDFGNTLWGLWHERIKNSH